MSQNDDRPKLDGPHRELVGDAEKARLQAANGLAVDSRRSRPRYFDGRFLAARDLTNDQDYALRRQADLARASGWGVVHGLEVFPSTVATRVKVRSGMGYTPGGEPVILPRELDVDLLSMNAATLLDAHLGLGKDRSAMGRSRVGPFVLALRPIEYTSGSRAGYPTTVQGTTTLQDHEIVEATALTLIPWPNPPAGNPEAVRAGLARQIFVNQSGAKLPADVLPIAMVYLDGVKVQWVDSGLVRRVVGSAQEDLLGLGLVNRTGQAAYLRQYLQHITWLLQVHGANNFAASSYLEALPPVGPLPVSAVDQQNFTQRFFPAEVDVDLSFVPADELPALLEESLLLPAIDLRASPEQLAATSVLILVPVDRPTFRRYKSTLGAVRRPLVRRIERAPVLRTPLVALSNLKLPSVVASTATTGTASSSSSSPWTTLLEQAVRSIGTNGVLWYVRRRNLNSRAEIQGDVVDIDLSGGQQ
ncbi:MAG TPA: hypothetical protein PLA94_06120 [Myxococcota bacterium]|nr:hypothetical protein [Myxococcota bacterium]